MITKSKAKYYRGRLELQKTVALHADDPFSQNDAIWSTVAVDDNRLAPFAHDRSVSVTDVPGRREKHKKCKRYPVGVV